MKKTAKALMIVAGVALMTSGVAYASTNDKGIPVQDQQVAVEKQQGKKLTSKNPNAYTDVKGHFSATAVERLLDMGLFKNHGETNNKFNPDAKLTRSELKNWVKMGFGSEASLADGTETAVSRIEIATTLAAALPPMNTGINGGNLKAPFSDIEGLTAEQRAAVDLLYKLGIMVGDGQGHFAPNAGLTRGEGAMLLERGVTRALSVAQNITFETLNQAEELPESVYTMVKENQTEAGVYSVEDNGVRYIMVAGGEAPTAGFSVAVDRMSETAAGLFLEAQIHQPTADQMHAEVISYPYQILKVTNVNKPVFLY